MKILTVLPPIASLLFAATMCQAQTAPGAEADGCAPNDAPFPFVESSPESRGFPAVAVRDVFEEAKRYIGDAGALITNPIHWDSSDLKKAAVFGASLGILFLADESIAAASQRTRSHFTDEVSRATSDFGASYAWYISGALFVGGLVAREPGLRDTGREAVEAAVFAGLITDGLKSALGRERPNSGNDETVFHPFSGNKSFPSGHATTAFAVASVIAMRTDGWIIPTLAYATAFTVAMDRINDRAHFASDVFTGAAIGLTTGRFLVNRHRAADDETPRVRVDLFPIRDGLSAHVTF